MFNIMNIKLCQIMAILTAVHPTLQNCPREILAVSSKTKTEKTFELEAKCYINDTIVTQNCSDLDSPQKFYKLAPCSEVLTYVHLSSCPPGYSKLTENNDNYCYRLGKPTPWDYPCLNSGESSVITDLSADEITYLLNNLRAANRSRYFWLPAQKRNHFSHVVWKIPGPNWGKRVVFNERLHFQDPFLGNCLLLDIEKSMLLTEACRKRHPIFCFFINNLHQSVECPRGYYYFRYTHENSACYGIATSDTPQGLSYHDFQHEKCNRPMSDAEKYNRFIFQKIAHVNQLPDDVWCWFDMGSKKKQPSNHSLSNQSSNNLQGIINNAGALGLMHTNFPLTCMACKTEIINRETELMFEYDYIQNLLFLSIYNPSGLWKYDNNDKGFQCFSDGNGFVRVIHVNDQPIMIRKPGKEDKALGQIEKIVYVVELISNSSAQYWCEGHSNNFSLIATDKLIVNPKGNTIHVFCLVIKYYHNNIHNNKSDFSALISNITYIYDAKRVLVMDIFDYTLDHMFVLLHLHIALDELYDDVALNVNATFNNLTNISESKLEEYNYTFENLSSSMYCLPIYSPNSITLDWEMTLIGHFTAPKQFCLQSNGLPVKRQCRGSYKYGGKWGDVEGECDNTYMPSTTTTFLYTFVKRPAPWLISDFLTDGLNFVLGDPDVIIPADIYYLSRSLHQISDMAQDNLTCLETTDIEHLAWIMDRVMILDWEYLRLAQTLNSTNVIVDSISEIIEITLRKNWNESIIVNNTSYQIVVKSQFVVQISYPDFNNITGIAIINTTDSNNFTDTSIYPLYKNTTLDDVLSIENLEIATWIPTNMLDTLHKYNNSEDLGDSYNKLHIIITIYHNDAVFQQIHNNHHVINSRIIGVSIPEYMSNLEHPIPIISKQINNSMNSFCGYWEFQSPNSNYIPGVWRRRGCYKVQTINNITVCECYHLTHFGQLFYTNTVESNYTLDKGHSIALNLITLVGSFLSLFGIVGIWVTALIFSNWRKKASTKVLLQLSTAIALPLVFMVIFNLHSSMFTTKNEKYVIATNMETSCIILGAMLHFSILASFMWMLITAVLQFIRYVRVLGVRRPARFMFKFALIGWGIPLIPVVITLSLDCNNYIPPPAKFQKICYPSGNYLIGAALLPICLILLINVGLFISVLYAISRRSNASMKNTDMDLVGAQLRVSIFLFFLLGLTWVFGIFSFSNSLIWSYMFCLTSTIQGFVLFIYFVICDPSTRGLWVTLMTPQFNPNSSRNSITSISTG